MTVRENLVLPMTLAGLCARVRSIKVYELADWSTFDNTQFMSDIADQLAAHILCLGKFFGHLVEADSQLA